MTEKWIRWLNWHPCFFFLFFFCNLLWFWGNFLYVFPNISSCIFFLGFLVITSLFFRCPFFAKPLFHPFLCHFQLLELRCPVPAATTSCPWFTWYILPERCVSLDCLNCSSWLPSDINSSFIHSSLHHKGAAWGLCWAGEACSWVWWLWVQGVRHVLLHINSGY